MPQNDLNAYEVTAKMMSAGPLPHQEFLFHAAGKLSGKLRWIRELSASVWNRFPDVWKKFGPKEFRVPARGEEEEE